MMRLGVATKGQSLLQALEVPSIAAPIRDEAEEEPPSSSASSMRSRFFGHVSEKDWCDWKWQFRNRVATVDELARYISLSTEELARLKLVTIKYPLSVTPLFVLDESRRSSGPDSEAGGPLF